MIRSVLCAIDVNRPDDEAKVLQRALKLAEAEGAQLDVITVMPDYGMSVVGGYFKEDHKDTARDHVKALLNACVEKALGSEANAKVRHLIGVGAAYHEILAAAKAAGSDLIVLGAHRPDLSDYLLGPNAARVVRHSTCSVYVVR